MKHPKFGFVIFCICLLCSTLSAQLVVVQGATRQGYASGACCEQGVDYVIQLRINQPMCAFTIDSVWIDARMFPAPKASGGTLQITRDSLGSTLVLHEMLRWGRYEMLDMNVDSLRPARVASYRGLEAVVFYHARGVPHRISIGKLTELMPIPYP